MSILKQVLWDRIKIPELSLVPEAKREMVEWEAKTRFIDALAERARPEHAEFIMHRALEGNYLPILSLYDTVDHLYACLQRRDVVPYDPGGKNAGLAMHKATINALGVFDEHGNLKTSASGSLAFDPQFARRVIHETAHVVDLNHPSGEHGYSEGNRAYLQARTQDGFHARLMNRIHEVLADNHCLAHATGDMPEKGGHRLSEMDKAKLERHYQAIKRWYDGRVADPGNEAATFAATEPLPPTLREYFVRLPESNSAVSEQMGQLLAKNAELAKDPVNAYMQLLREQYAAFGGIRSDGEFIQRLGTDIKQNVIKPITEIGYSERDKRVHESIAKAIDACNVSLNHTDHLLGDRRNPIAALHIPHLEEYIEAHVYEDVHRRNLKSRERFKPRLEQVLRRLDVDPEKLLHWQQQEKIARQARWDAYDRARAKQHVLRKGQEQGTAGEPTPRKVATGPSAGDKPRRAGPLIVPTPPAAAHAPLPDMPAIETPLGHAPEVPVAAAPNAAEPHIHSPVGGLKRSKRGKAPATGDVKQAMEEAAGHWGQVANWACGLGLVALGGWVAWEVIRRQSKRAAEAAEERDKLEFRGGASVAVGTQQRVASQSALDPWNGGR